MLTSKYDFVLLDTTDSLSYMNLLSSIAHAESSLIAQLKSKQEGIDDRTGKGSATEKIITEQLLNPQLPSGVSASKGAIIGAESPNSQSPAIDRIIHDSVLAAPLVHSDDHSIFPIEAVIGVVEITMRLDATKLLEDIKRIAVVRAMKKRRYLIPIEGKITQAHSETVDGLSPRSFIVGMPADSN